MTPEDNQTHLRFKLTTLTLMENIYHLDNSARCPNNNCRELAHRIYKFIGSFFLSAANRASLMDHFAAAPNMDFAHLLTTVAAHSTTPSHFRATIKLMEVISATLLYLDYYRISLYHVFPLFIQSLFYHHNGTLDRHNYQWDSVMNLLDHPLNVAIDRNRDRTSSRRPIRALGTIFSHILSQWTIDAQLLLLSPFSLL